MDVVQRARESGVAALRGLALFCLTTVVGLTLFSVTVLAISLIGIGIGIFLLPPAADAVRRLADRSRDLAGRWAGTPIARPYLPRPTPEPGFTGRWQRCQWVLTDRAFWRDLLWTLTDPIVAGFTALLPAAFIVQGLFGLMLAGGVWRPIVDTYGGTQWYTFLPVADQPTALLAGVLGAVYIAIGLGTGRRLLAVHASWTRVLLAPTPEQALALRVRHLTRTRTDAVDTQASELRRIERDLHDGAQARLVAMGMSLGAVEHLLDRDPEKARVLLAEARETSATALRELRDLVRGIHPPVLADRGLGDAVRALALDLPMRIDVDVNLPGRLDPPVESAAYFAVSELLANASKHSGAQRVWIDLRHHDGSLRVIVTDDGIGGASVADGTGLRGIERRIGTFDGVLALNSPQGGPTIVTMELPCASSSPRTSLC
ncbi:sensor histidine kinase [Actinomadura sp. HBU206391]|uniref:sensor histidine kinase n=1 Tax=Actinomadura sp. HBU206391 TaxID=2731692 RepID=UPI00164F33AD|nr:sensor histidine kinase [Actinomadura sp. HBU206391]MBC6457315.1 sensor domain-containing protein [Actinomadura sp. HBU206391]